MPKSTRDYQQRSADQAVGNLDMFLHNMHMIHSRYQEALDDYEKERSAPGGEFLEKYRPDYSEQMAATKDLSAFAVELQGLVTRFKKELM